MARTIERMMIERALDLIRDKHNWTKDAVTRRSNGRRCDLTDDSAVRYCAFGALVRAAIEICGAAEPKLILSAEQAILQANGWDRRTRLAYIDDRHGHTVIVQAFERALATG